MGLQYVFSFEAQLHNLSELINTNDWYGYGELNSFWIQQDDNFFMIENFFRRSLGIPTPSIVALVPIEVGHPFRVCLDPAGFKLFSSRSFRNI